MHKDKYGGHSTKKEQEEAEAAAGGIGDKIKQALRLG